MTKSQLLYLKQKIDFKDLLEHLGIENHRIGFV